MAYVPHICRVSSHLSPTNTVYEAAIKSRKLLHRAHRSPIYDVYGAERRSIPNHEILKTSSDYI